jgi:hypothetical protein
VFTAQMIGRSKLVRANAENPYYEPLSRLALMSFGPGRAVARRPGRVRPATALILPRTDPATRP